MFKCPHCKKEIEQVTVRSTGSQNADINSAGEVNEYYGFDGFDEAAMNIWCPKCCEDIKEFIKE